MPENLNNPRASIGNSRPGSRRSQLSAALTEAADPGRNLFGTPRPSEAFAGIAAPDTDEGLSQLRKIADKIGRSGRPGARSDITARAAYLAQFAAEDLGCLAQDARPGRTTLDLGPVYTAPDAQDACDRTSGRHLLRIGRPTATADREGPEPGQMQVLWALMHNAIAATLAKVRTPDVAFELASQINRGIYRDVIRHDVLGAWLMPRFRDRYLARTPRRLAQATVRTPAEFLTGVGRLAHGLARDIGMRGEQTQVTGLRDLVRHGSGDPTHDAPLVGDWLVEFSRLFGIGTSVPQRARALGPHAACSFATGMGVGTDGTADGLVLRDLIACAREGVRSVRSLISRASRAEPHLFKGCFAQDETGWSGALAEWLADTGLAPEEIERLACDPPLTLFLMLEAEADTGGRTLGALGSIIIGETLTGAMPAQETDIELPIARAVVFGDHVPVSLEEAIHFLQRRCRRAEAAGRHDNASGHSTASGGTAMLDIETNAGPAIPRIDVTDYIEMGRLVAQWAVDPASRPDDVAGLRRQLVGIAAIPAQIKTIEFVQSTVDHLILRLPVKEMIEESLDRVTDPMSDGRYPLPQFYADHYRPGFGPVMTPLDILLGRIGDYTIAQCR